MSDKPAGKGGCLCAVRVSVPKMNVHAGACHCGMCRKWTGGPLLAVDCGSEVSFERMENITVYNSSEWAERGFCKKCGGHLFYRLKQGNRYIVPVGVFDNPDTFVFDHHIFIDEKPAFYAFANQTKNMTGAEVFAQYATTTG